MAEPGEIHQSTKSLLYKHEEPIWFPEPMRIAGHGGLYLQSQPWADGAWQISGTHWTRCQWGTSFQKQNQTNPSQMVLEEAWHLRLSFDLNMHKHPCVNSPNIHKQKRQIFKRWQIQVIVKSKICFQKLWYRQRMYWLNLSITKPQQSFIFTGLKIEVGITQGRPALCHWATSPVFYFWLKFCKPSLSILL